MSVQFLQALSPQLTNLYLPDVTKIARASVNPFCQNNDVVIVKTLNDAGEIVKVDYKLASDSDTKSQLTCPYPKNPNAQQNFNVFMRVSGDTVFCYGAKPECDTQFSSFQSRFTLSEGVSVGDLKIEYFPPPTKAPTCVGTYCGVEPEQVCYPSDPYARAFECKSAKNACEDTDDKRNGCEEVNTWLKYQGYRDQQCAKVVKTGQGDSCVLGRPLQCPNEYSVRVQGDAVFATDAEKKCWEKKGQSEAVLKDCTAWYDPRQIYPVLSGEAIEGASALCCQKPNSNDYKCETEKTDTVVVKLEDIQQSTDGSTDGQKFGSTCNEGKKPINKGSVCSVMNYFAGATDVTGLCDIKDGYVRALLSWSSIQRGVCVPDDNAKYGVKICYGNAKSTEQNWYAQLSDCTAENQTYANDCATYLISSGISCIGETPASPPDDVDSVLNTEIKDTVETVVQNSTLKQKFANQTIGFNEPPLFGVNTAFAAEKIDACTFVQAIIAKESSGNAKAAVPSNGGVDCGLMQIHLTSGSDRTACENEKDKNDLDSDGNYDENLLDPGFNVAVGVQRLINWFNSSKLCGSGTSCDAAKRGTAGGDKLYRYVLAANNGGSEANKKSGTDGVCSIESAEAEKCCANSCKDLKNKDGSQACYISSQSDIFPTKVECPNDRGEYQGTYDYVFKIEELYKSLKNTGGAGVASCPS